MNQQTPQLDYDWYPGSIPENIEFGADCYVDTSYSFASFHSRQQPGMELGRASGVYIRASIVSGPEGRVKIGDYTCLNGVYVICNKRVEIGDHCLLAWGAVITDTWTHHDDHPQARRRLLEATASSEKRPHPTVTSPQPVILEDNVWVGFDAVVLPGARVGRGSIIGCKSVVADDVQPYSVVVGNPARIIQRLSPDDTANARRRALEDCTGD